MTDDLAVKVARLAGYLSGLAAEDGDIRQYTASAFVVAGKDSVDSPEAMVHDFYAAQTDLRFSSSQKLERGLGDLERQIGGFLIRKPWGLAENTIAQEVIDNRRRFLAFRIMDMIDDISPEAFKLRNVYKLESMQPGPVSQVSFFCVQIKSGFLVLQFNDDMPFIQAHGA
jgi:hypothetical protein